MQDKDRGELFPKVVAKFIRTIVDLEQNVEQAKIDLLENHLFNPYVAFQYLDRFRQGYATKADIHAMFQKYSIDISDQEVDYLMYYKGKVGSSASSLSRPDAFFYENFLNLLAPSNSKSLASNLSAQKDIHAGKAQVLPSYVFDQFLDYLLKELKTFDALQSLKVEMINLYGYTATPAYKLISPDDNRVTYFELKIFLERQGFTLSQPEFQNLCSLHETGRLDYLTKSSFLNLFTPFDKNVYRNVGERTYATLSDVRNHKLLQEYLSNAYRYVPPQQKTEQSDPRIQEVAKIMQNLYSNHQEVDRFSKKNLYVSPDGKVMYDLTKKQFPYHHINGFKDYYDPYHKQLYRELKTETHDFLLGQPADSLKKEVAGSDPHRQGETFATYAKTVDKRPSSTLPIATELNALKMFSRPEFSKGIQSAI